MPTRNPSRFSAQHGYTMVVVMVVMLVGTLVALGAWAAARGDLRPAAKNIEAKRAYSAAQAGVGEYLQKLNDDNEYWLKCTAVPALSDGSAAPINQPWSGSGADPRIWRPFGPAPNTAYTIELLPRSPYTTCQQNVDASMLDSAGTIQVRSTGRSGPTTSQTKRSLITTLRRNGFLDFLYFTQFEESDPAQKTLALGGFPIRHCDQSVPDGDPSCPQDNIATWATSPATCDQYVRDGRDSVAYNGSFKYNGSWNNFSLGCGSIQFVDSDFVSGPLHTDDSLSICGAPKMGRNRSGNTSAPIDSIEYYASSQTCSGSDDPDVGNNKTVKGSALTVLNLPQSNDKLKQVAQSTGPNGGGLYLTGNTSITLNGTTISYTNNGVTKTNQPLPPNGVIYVDGGTSTCTAFNIFDPYAGTQTGCGDVRISGTYSSSLTIAAQRDVIVTGDIKATSGSNALLGLIANNYVRVEHKVASYPCTSSTAESGTPPTNRVIEAAILSLGHVFTVDNYQCGDPLGTLTVKGAIAQKYRGPVGTHNGATITTGYQKAYNYDDRLKYRSPPYFLSPVQSAWRVLRTTEQTPPR